RESRGAWRPSFRPNPGSCRFARDDPRDERSIPLERSFFPHVDEADGEDRDEYDHFTESEECDLAGRTDAVGEWSAARQLAERCSPWNEEDGFDVEDNEQHRDHVELHGEAFAGIAQRRHSGLVRGLFFWSWTRPEREVGDDEHHHRVCRDEAHQQKNRKVVSSHPAPSS